MIPVLEYIENRKAPIKIAHRGGMFLYPENTLEAFHGSVDNYKVEMLEMDLQITKDNKVIVLHDPTLNRTTNGKGNVNDLSYEEISDFDAGYHFKDKKGNLSFKGKGVKIPLFEDVLKQLSNTYLNIELKGNNPKLVEEIRPLITQYNAEEKILIGSGNYIQNKRVHLKLPNCGHYLSRPEIYLFGIFGGMGFGSKYWKKFQVAEVPLIYHGVHVYPLMQKAARRMRKPIFVWGVNDKQSYDKLKEDGAAGIMTDRPELF